MARERQCTVCGLWVRIRSDQWTVGGDEFLYGAFADDDRNYIERERVRIVNLDSQAIQREKEAGGRPTGALVALFEWMIGRNTEAKDAGEVENIPSPV